MTTNLSSSKSYQELLEENNNLHAKLIDSESNSEKTISALRLENNQLKTEIIGLRLNGDELNKKVEELEGYLNWFKRNLLGSQSEKSIAVLRKEKEEISKCYFTGEEMGYVDVPLPEAEKVVSYERKKRGQKIAFGTNNDSGLRIGDGVEIFVNKIFPKEVEGLHESEYEIVGVENSDRVVQRGVSYYVARDAYIKIKPLGKELINALNDVIKVDINAKSTDNTQEKKLPIILKAKVPQSILPRSYMSLSFIVSMIIDKCVYSMPIYRQHAKLKNEGIYLNRGSLISNFNLICSQLTPIIDILKSSILMSRILAIDETPIKVGLDQEKHKMKQGYIWPMFGDKNEILYTYDPSRSSNVVGNLCNGYTGTLLTDGYSAYTSYINAIKESELSANITHASCWIHSRRQFLRLENTRPAEHAQAFEYIGKLYKIEESLVGKELSEKYRIRQTLSTAVVDDYFNWLKSFNGQTIIATNSSLRKAVEYSLDREKSLREFLKDPNLPLDTNHVEREIRPIAIGRKNWMFCWTEAGANSLCIAQSLIRTCMLHGVNPRTYLIDVLQRLYDCNLETDDISDLVPRLWKETYADSPIQCPSEAFVDQIIKAKIDNSPKELCCAYR